jgi:hypothetical protein
MFLQSRHKLRWAVAVFILIVMAANNFYFYFRGVSRSAPDEAAVAIIDVLSQSGARDERLLVPKPYQPMLHYYFQGTKLSGYSEDQTTQEISSAVRTNGFEGVIYEGRDFDGLGKILRQDWTVQSVIKLESYRVGRAVAYYRLRPIR